MTREEMLAVSEAAWDGFNERDWDEFYRHTQPDAVIRTDPLWPGGGEFRSREELLQFLEQFLEPWETLSYERRDAEVTAGNLVELGSWLGKGRATGIDGRIDFTMVTGFRDGLIERIEFFIDHEKALDYART